MKRLSFLFGLLSLMVAAAFLAGCDKNGTTPEPTPGPDVPSVERTGESGISYQLLVYSFADSDGDGCGDFRGIQSKLDYLKEMGSRLSGFPRSTKLHPITAMTFWTIPASIRTTAPRPISNPFWTRHTPKGSRFILTMC